MDGGLKKQKSENNVEISSKKEAGYNPVNDDSNIGNESDSDADYDDLDDLALPSDTDDLMDDDGDPDEDDKSVHSTATTSEEVWKYDEVSSVGELRFFFLISCSLSSDELFTHI